jgi:hypothetical protein
MWHLAMIDSAGHAIAVGTFNTITDVRRRIMELEHYPLSGVHLEMHIDASLETNDKDPTHFKCRGRATLYTVTGHDD